MIIEDICLMQYSRFIIDSYKTPTCDLIELDNGANLYCQVKNTVGFPIKEECFDGRIVHICTIKNNTQTCFGNQTNNISQIKFYNA